MSGKARKQCEIRLMATEQRPGALVRIEAVVDEGGRECRMVVMDITRKMNSRVGDALPSARFPDPPPGTV